MPTAPITGPRPQPFSWGQRFGITPSSGKPQIPGLRWGENAAAVTRTDANELNASHVFSSLVRNLGYTTQADSISATYLSELFT